VIPVCCSLSVTDKNWNFSAVRSLIELKLSGDLGLVSQISVFWLQDSIVFHIVDKQKNNKNAKIAVLQNLRFLRRAESD
jgi:hypothetical protein